LSPEIKILGSGTKKGTWCNAKKLLRMCKTPCPADTYWPMKQAVRRLHGYFRPFRPQCVSNCNILFDVTFTYKVNVKCTLVQVLRLCTALTAHRGSRSIALLFHDQRH